nr:hypothetical protein [Tanacetum cinerariifolium]
MTIEPYNWSSSAQQELHKIVKDENFPIINQVDAIVQNFEIQFLKEAAKFVGDFKYLAKEVDESLAKHKALELEIELSASSRTKPITVSQPSIITKKRINSNSNGLSSTRLDNTKTRRPQPRSNTKNDRVPSASKSSRSMNKDVKVEEHHRNLLLSKKTKHMSSACNSSKIDSQDVKSKVAEITPSYMDLCSPMRIASINEKRNNLILGLPKFKYHKEHLYPSCEQGKSKRASHPPKPIPNSRQRSKDEALEVIKTFLKRITFLLQSPVIMIRTDNGKEFKNQVLKEYFDCVGISHQVTSVRTPQQNGIVERRNQTLVEAARTMLIFSRAPLFLWAEAIATVCFTQNRSIIRRRFNKTPYKLIKGRKPDISFLHVFGAMCYPKNDRDDIGKLGAKGDIGFFIGYSADSCAYRVYNHRTKKIMETINVSFDELSSMAFEQPISKPELQSLTSRQISSGLDLNYAPSTITSKQPTEGELDLLFKAMYDDYIGGQPSATAKTFPTAQEPQNHFFKGTIDLTLFIRRFDDDILVVQVYVDDIIFGSTHPRYTKSLLKMSMMGEMMFFLGLQVNKSPCGIIINQSKYVLEILKKYGMESCDPVGTAMEIKDKLDLDQNGTLVDAMKYHSMIGVLMYFMSSRSDIVHATCLCAWYQAKPTEKHLEDVKRIFCYLWGIVNTGLWYTKDSSFELIGFSDADYAGCKDTFKSTSGGAQFLGQKLVSWSLKKQDYTAMSTAEAEYVSLFACWAKVLWMRT